MSKVGEGANHEEDVPPELGVNLVCSSDHETCQLGKRDGLI